MKQPGVLLRLRIAHLFFGMMFFYGIEQVFLDKYIGPGSARGYVTVLYILGLLVFDIPTGILADRVGRKKTLLIGCAVLVISLLILGLSRTLPAYLLGAGLYGLFIALWNGAAQALLYDWLASEGDTKSYSRLQGSVYALFLAGAALANFSSGFMAEAFGLASPYFISVVPALLAAVALWGIYEPPLEARDEPVWYHHLRLVTAGMLNNRQVMISAIRLMIAEVMVLSIGEFGQIYILSFGISTVMLGILWAVNAIVAAGGRSQAHRLQTRPTMFIAIYCLVMAAFIAAEAHYGIALFIVAYGLNEALANIAETEIQHATKSKVRATTLSVVGFAGNVLAIPIILGYTFIYTKYGIITANRWVGLSFIVVLLLGSIRLRKRTAAAI
ncbi:MAG: MFS transporter [Candidatus Saccharimonadales bacterium]